MWVNKGTECGRREVGSGALERCEVVVDTSFGLRDRESVCDVGTDSSLVCDAPVGKGGRGREGYQGLRHKRAKFVANDKLAALYSCTNQGFAELLGWLHANHGRRFALCCWVSGEGAFRLRGARVLKCPSPRV